MRHLMIRVDERITKNAFYQVIANPQIYLKNLLVRTIYIGLFTGLISWVVEAMDMGDRTFPSTMHSLIGFIIGLLLVFRVNTAYERWWDGRKIIGNMESEVSLLNARLNVINKNSTDPYSSTKIKMVKDEFRELLILLCGYLIGDRSTRQTSVFNAYQTKASEKIMQVMSSYDKSDACVNGVFQSINNIVGHSGQLSRIKNTPIPIAFVYHIKISVLIYLVTLPFGVFHDMGIWSVPLVMLMYFIIAGVEIISSEIENPFAGDPNDLPTEKLFDSMLKTLENE